MIQGGELDFSGITINYLNQGGVASDEYILACADEFEQLTGAEVVVDPTPWEAQMPKIVNDVTTGANRYDVFEGDIEFQYGLYAYMEEITPYIEKYNVQMDGFFDPMYTFGEWSGLGRFGLPFSTGISSITIRTDVFDAAGIEYPFDTWEDFYAAVAEVNDPDNGFYGTSFAGVNAQLVKMFLARYWGQKKAVFNENWGAQVDGPEGYRATELMIEYKNYAAPGVQGWDLPEAAAAFLAGDAAVYENWYVMLAGIIDNPDESNVVDKWTVIPAPGGGPSGNWTQHNVDLLKASQNKDAAFCWMAYITSEERQVAWAKDEVEKNIGGFDYSRTAAWTDARLPALPQLQGNYDALQAGIPIVAGLPQWLEAFMSIGEHVGQAMNGDLTAEEAMAGLQATLEGIIQQAIPPYKCIEPKYVE
jgi:ABC-type glycerol-3-phosphate transport system substrate-binding protein